jgi:hypothetical protein
MVMRKQVHDYIKRKLQRSVSETETFQDFISFASLKALVMEVDAIKVKQMMPKQIPWLQLMTSKATLAIITCHFCYNWGSYVIK